MSFNPDPVEMTTTRSEAPTGGTPSCVPATTSASPAKAAAAAGSGKMPESADTVGIISRMASSSTDTQPPPVSTTAAIALTRSRGRSALIESAAVRR